MAAPPDLTNRLMALGRLDLRPQHETPALWRVALASGLAIVLSLGADAALVALGTHVFASTRGYVHFRFSDYAKLTIIGILGAGAAWPVVARVSSAPRWLYLRLAVLVTIVLWAPDVYIWHAGQPARAVAVLMCMHLAIALITYNVMVRLAPVRARSSRD
jgi:hypothetical protein